MIADYKDRWVICTPTKCGTYSLEGTLIDRMNAGYKIVPRHRCDCPVAGERIMVVRHPFDRWCSMYWFIKQEPEHKIWMGEWARKGINDFATEWWRRRNEEPHWMWTYNLAEHAKEFCPTVVFKQENGFNDLLEHLHRHYGHPLVKVSHRNKTRERESVEATLMQLSDENLKNVATWASEDAKLFDYDLTRVS